MFFYIGWFVVSLCLIFFAENYLITTDDIIQQNNINVIIAFKKVFYIAFIIIAVLIPSLIAGLRDYSIGTDVMIYGNIWFNNAVHTSDFFSYIQWALSSSIGFLYATFNYVIAKFTQNPHYFYFWYSFAENFIVFWAIKRNRDIVKATPAMAVYLFMFFNLTLNILRQGMALIILVWGFKNIRNKQFLKYAVVVLIAYLFHSTAILGIFIYFIYWLVNDNLSELNELLLIILCLLGIILFQTMSNSLLNNSLINQRYSVYTINQSGGFYQHFILLCMPTLLLYLFSYIRKDNVFKGLRIIVIFSTLLGFLTLQVASLGRITQYFDIFFIFALPYVLNSSYRIHIKNVSLNNVILLIYLIVYWIIIYSVMKSGQTVPYIYMQS